MFLIDRHWNNQSIDLVSIGTLIEPATFTTNRETGSDQKQNCAHYRLINCHQAAAALELIFRPSVRWCHVLDQNLMCTCEFFTPTIITAGDQPTCTTLLPTAAAVCRVSHSLINRSIVGTSPCRSYNLPPSTRKEKKDLIRVPRYRDIYGEMVVNVQFDISSCRCRFIQGLTTVKKPLLILLVSMGTPFLSPFPDELLFSTDGLIFA